MSQHALQLAVHKENKYGITKHLYRPTKPYACMVTNLLLTVSQNVTFLANVLRYVRYMLSAVRLLSVCRLSVCDVGAPYSGG